MRKISILIILLLSVFVKIKAQCIPDSFYRTDWRINLGNPSQNKFNWVKIQPQVVAYILGKTGIDSVPLPYYCLKPPGSGSCDNENLYYFHDLEKTKQDIRPEEGWELIIADFGSPIVRIENPRFILYNKYTGKLRIFVLITDELDFEHVSLWTKMNNQQPNYRNAALFQFVKGIGNSLDDWDPLLSTSAINKYESQSNYWVWTEFQTSYDPCTCNGSLNSKRLSTEIRSFKSDSVKLFASGTITQIIKNGNAYGQNGESGGGSNNFLDNLNNGAEAASKGYNSWKSLSNNYMNYANTGGEFLKKQMQKKLLSTYLNTDEQYLDSVYSNWQILADSLWQRLGWMDADYTDLLVRMSCNSLVSPTDDDAVFLNKYESINNELGTVNERIDNLQKYLNKSGELSKALGVVKSVAEIAPYIGAAISIYKLFTAGGSNTSVSSAPQSSPFTAEINMKIIGTITSQKKEPTVSYYLPGSNHSRTNSEAPYYNNILGIFNILKTPTFEHVTYLPDSNSYTQSICEVETEQMPNVKAYRLKNEIKYVFNPASQLKIESIDACYVLDYNDIAFEKSVAFHPMGQEYMGNLSPSTFSKYADSIHYSTGWDVEYYDPTNGKVMVRTPYMPLAALKNYAIMLTDRAVKPKIIVKFFIRASRIDNPNADQVTLVHTFHTKGFENSIPYNNINYKFTAKKKYIWNNNFPDQLQFPGCSKVTGYKPLFANLLSNPLPPFHDLISMQKIVHFTSGTILTGDVYADIIIIDAGVIIQPGTRIMAKTKIQIKPGVNIGPNIKILIGDRFMDNNGYFSAYSASTGEIASICTSNSYQAKIQIFPSSPFDPINNNSNDSLISNSLDIYPNPTENYFVLKFISQNKFNGIVKIYNSTGILVKNETFGINQGLNQMQYSVNDLSKGLYLIVFYNQEGKRIDSKKLIIQ